MSRYNRHAKLLELIAKNEVDTQEELSALLINAGYCATQATVSRDIKDLGLIKVAGKTRKYRYAKAGGGEPVNLRFSDLFRHSVLSIDSAMNTVVIKTLAGSANVAGMMIDGLGNASVLGCVAGDDTVFAVLKSEDAAKELVQFLREAAHLK